MKILIVNAFDDEIPKSVGHYRIFKELIEDALKKSRNVKCQFVERRLNHLGDCVVDWEFDSLHDFSRANSMEFDLYDIIFIGGDMRICPWDPIASQVVTLIQMCKFTKKPLFCCGFGAFSAVYTLATKGARFHILNGPNGSEIEKLPSFERYSNGSGAYPSGWLDNETGDIYTYQPKLGVWQPTCNIGIYYIPHTGKPTQNRQKPKLKKFAREDRTLSADQRVEALDNDAEVARIRSEHVQHYSVKNFPAQNFTMKSYLDWYIRGDSSLPARENLFVVADGTNGAVLLAKDNMLITSCRMEKPKGRTPSSSRNILFNFVSKIVKEKELSTSDRIESSLLTFLFGPNGFGGGAYDSSAHRKPMSQALAKQPIRSIVPGGPVKVNPPRHWHVSICPEKG